MFATLDPVKLYSTQIQIVKGFMKNQNPPSSKDTQPSDYRIPQSVVQACRDEIDNELLRVEVWKLKDGKLLPINPRAAVNYKLPADLHGDCFFAAALPPRPIAVAQDQPPISHRCQRVVEAQGNLIINGDGMIYRLTLWHGTARMKTRIAKTPCYYADIITEKDPKTYSSKTYAFQNNGPSRMSLMLGSRNQLNTAFLKTPDHRLLVTFDAGRPWEIDPETMELLAPVGMKQEWLSLFPFLENSVFPVLSSPAHPVFGLSSNLDSSIKDEIFTLNYSIGYKGKFRKQFDRLINWNRLYGFFKRLTDQNTEKTWRKRWIGFTDLIHYDFNTPEPRLQRWQLVLEGSPRQLVIGEQSLHQVAITENYIIFGDTAFKVEFSQLFFSCIFGLPERLLNRVGRHVNQTFTKVQRSERKTIHKRWFLEILSSLEALRLRVGYWLYQVFRKLLPPSQYTHFYIIDRGEISKYAGCTLEDAMIDFPVKNLPVKKVTIPREVSHFAVDYCDRHKQIILHVGHNNGWDVTEWISQYDISVKGKESQFGTNRQPHRLGGMIVGTTDLGALGRYTIDASKGEIIDAKVVLDARLTWGVSVYTHRELDYSHQVISDLYWLCTGFSWELIPERIFEIYKNSPLRVVPHEKLLETELNKPITLLRLDTQQTKIVDWFQFPSGYYVCSPQFIPSSEPCPPGKDQSIHGYIACVVLSDSSQGDEFWIFDASNLGNRQDLEDDSFSQPVVYRLSSPHKLNLGFSIHSTWCSEYVRNMASIRYSDRQYRQQRRKDAFEKDYKDLQYHENKKENEKITKLLNDNVQGYFIEQNLEKELE